MPLLPHSAGYRDWRTANSKGGDFEVFSDIASVSAADSFTFNK